MNILKILFLMLVIVSFLAFMGLALAGETIKASILMIVCVGCIIATILMREY